MEPKSMPKLIKNQCKNETKKDHDKHEIFGFSERSKHANSSEGSSNLKVLRGGRTNGEVIKQPSKIRPKTIPKSMENQLRFRPRRTVQETLKSIKHEAHKSSKMCQQTV
jgi:hypothetical protein